MADEEVAAKQRHFSSLNHPELTPNGFDENGKAVFVQLYDIFEVILDEAAPHGVRHEPVARNKTAIQVSRYIRKYGAEDA